LAALGTTLAADADDADADANITGQGRRRMNWSEFWRHNRWQKLTALLLALLIWFTVSRKIRTGGGVRLTFDGSSRVFEGVPIRLLVPNDLLGRCTVVPNLVAVTLRGDPGLLNRLHPEQIQAFASLDAAPAQEISLPLQVVAPGFDVIEVSLKEVLIRPISATNSPR